MRKKIDIDYAEGEGLNREEFKGTIELKRLNFSEKNALEEESTDIKFNGNVPTVKVSTSKLKELSLLKSIVSSEIIRTTFIEDKVTKKPNPINEPYPMGLTGIKELPQGVGLQLFEEFTELNSVSPKKKVN